MTACESLQHIFQKPLPENNLRQSFSPWNLKPLDKDSQNFQDFLLKEDLDESSSPLSFSSSASYFSSSSFSSSSFLSSPFSIDFESNSANENLNKEKNASKYNKMPITRRRHHSDCLSFLSSESSDPCTKDLGFFSERTRKTRHASIDFYSSDSELKISRITGEKLPPPISSIGINGKPWVCYKSFRNNGRFILKEVRAPTQEFLHACREDGRLKMQFIQSDEEFTEDEEEDEEELEEDGEDYETKNNQSCDERRDLDEGNYEDSDGENIFEDEDGDEL